MIFLDPGLVGCKLWLRINSSSNQATTLAFLGTGLTSAAMLHANFNKKWKTSWGSKYEPDVITWIYSRVLLINHILQCSVFMYVKYVQSILYVSTIYTYSVYLVSLNGLVFKNVNFFQTKGTSALTYMFADVHIPMNL